MHRDRLTVAAEHGEPGARILVVDSGRARVFDPYGASVWHLHALVHLRDDLYAVSTGDATKALDVMRITSDRCELLERLVHHCGGFTGMSVHAGALWVGSDLSERANFIAPLTGPRYFLPRDCVREYVIRLRSTGPTRLEVITKRLRTGQGHALVFCTATRKFIAANPIEVIDSSRYAAIPG
jgi:hypothetical protein